MNRYKAVSVLDNTMPHQVREQIKSKLAFQGVFTLIGGFLVCLSFGSDLSYPNLNTYLISYMRVNGYNENLSYMDFVFLTTTKTLITGAAMPWLGALARTMGPKLAIGIGSAIYTGGFVLTYLALQHHFTLAILTLSLHGIGFCLVYPTAIRTAQAWFPPERKGLVASIVVSGYGFGSSLWAPLQTGFVNPNNIQAENKVRNCSDVREDENCTDTGEHKYFTDPAILGRVPLLFIILGGIYAVMGFMAVILIADTKEEMFEDDDEDNSNLNIQSNKTIRRNLSPLQVLKTMWFYQVYIYQFQGLIK